MIDTNSLEPFLELDYVNRLHWKEWFKVCENLSDEQMIKLIKTLTLIEKQLMWIGGSVSSVIWVFKALDKRGTYHTGELANWISSHTSNLYLPYGSLNYK